MSSNKETLAATTEGLSEREAAQLTVDLGSSFWGDHYDHAEIYGMVANYETRHWRSRDYKENPEQYHAAIQEQIERSQAVIEPYIGRLVTGKTENLVMRLADGSWEEWRTEGPFFAKGTIEAVEGHQVETRTFLRFLDPETVGRLAGHTNPGYRIGVVLRLETPPSRAVSLPRDIPETERVLVPIRHFPRSLERFSRLWSNQLS